MVAHLLPLRNDSQGVGGFRWWGSLASRLPWKEEIVGSNPTRLIRGPEPQEVIGEDSLRSLGYNPLFPNAPVSQ